MASAATVYGGGQYGLATDVSATGLVAATNPFTKSSKTAEAPDHIGNTCMVSIYDPRCEVSMEGVVAAKGTGMVGTIGGLITLSNTTKNTRLRLSENLVSAATTGAGIILTDYSLTPEQSGFEKGSLKGVYFAYLDTTSTYSAS